MIIDPLGIVPIERGGTGATTVEEAKEKLGITSNNEEKILFSSSSGTKTNITLNDDVSNYSYLIIKHSYGAAIVPIRYTNSFNWYLWDNMLDVTGIEQRFKWYIYSYSISGTSITRTTGIYVTFYKSGSVDYDTVTNMKIFTVIGYK